MTDQMAGTTIRDDHHPGEHMDSRAPSVLEWEHGREPRERSARELEVHCHVRPAVPAALCCVVLGWRRICPQSMMGGRCIRPQPCPPCVTGLRAKEKDMDTTATRLTLRAGTP